MNESKVNFENALEKSMIWCDMNPGWKRICDIDDYEKFYEKWDELSIEEQKYWGSEDEWNECAYRKCKIPYGFVNEKGEFYEEITMMPELNEFMMVFKVGE